MATVRLAPDPSVESLVSRVNQQVCAGYGHVTLDVRPGWDVEPVRAVRQAYPALTLAVDCGNAYTDLGQLVALDSYGLEVIERPFATSDVHAHASLQDEVTASVAVEAASPAELDDYLTLRAARVLLLRPAAFSSLSEVRRAHDKAAAAGWDIQCTGGQGAGLARAAHRGGGQPAGLHAAVRRHAAAPPEPDRHPDRRRERGGHRGAADPVGARARHRRGAGAAPGQGVVSRVTPGREPGGDHSLI
ncbi:hypothetical protein GCM10020220_062400 [Nonomuraea rubra]|uniref:enolase C-terminal domain-like protein n=1 Tax=Nonomuraea rubra TaxID=46180 RepID=UPI0031EC5A6E